MNRALPNTVTHFPAQAADYLLLISSQSSHGSVSGRVRLRGGFAQRFPAVGKVHVEVFGYNIQGSTVSLGASNPLSLTTNATGAKAFNNVFNPNRGGKTTIRYDVEGSGKLTMKLYSRSGAYVATVYEGDVPAGKGAVDWNGRNASGFVVASGVYLLKIEGPGLNKTVKVAVVK